jgi:transposase InsO family protein
MDSERKPTYHHTNKFRIEKTIDTWADVSPPSKTDPHQYRYLPVGLDSYSMVDLVSISLVKSLGLSPCTKTKHQHNEPILEGVGRTQPKTYGFFHLKLRIVDRWNHSLQFIRPFLAVDRNPSDSQVLLGRPTLKDFKISICNGIDSWEFERTPKVTKVSSHQFAQEITSSSVRVFEVRGTYRPCEDDTDPWEDDEGPNDLSSVPERLRRKYRDFFDTRNADRIASHRATDHAIELKPDTEPPYMRTYNMSPAELKALDEYINDALAKGWIRESQSPAGAPILFVPRKSGELRLCVDYRGLNAITIKNRYPLPLIGELLDRLNGATVFSKIDLRNAYHRIRIREGDEWKTAFRTRYGHFEYLVMPFGLTNAPATFQAYINRALRGLVDDFCVVYLDDILVFSKSEEEHYQHLELVVERLRNAELYANPKKCDFFKSEMEFLGFIVNEKGIRMDPARVQTISEWRNHPPKTYRDVQVFLGFCNFYRRFIYGFAGIARPLNQLLHGMKNGKKPGPIANDWQKPQCEAFERLIDAFISAPVLRHYDPDRKLRMETDASGTAYAGILSQQWENGWHPIAYFSRKFSGPELNYPIYDKELMAIVMGFRQWRHYLEGAPQIEVWSDHENLKQFMNQTVLNGRQARWLIQLAPYDFTIHYRKGSLNPADGPSRRPDYLLDPEDIEDTSVSKLMPSITNKLAIAAASRAGWQRQPKGSDPYAESLIEVLSLQACTRSEVRLAADNLVAHVLEAKSSTLTGKEKPSTLDVSEAKFSTLIDLIRNAQELDPQCRRISSQLRDLASQEPSLALAPQQLKLQRYSEDVILRDEGRVFVPPQEAIRNQLLEVFHDCPSGGHWGRDKTLDLIQRHFTWNGIAEDVRAYVATCPICQGKAIHRHRPYGQLQPLPVPTDIWDSPFKEISLDWIDGLPPSTKDGREYNSILTVVCRVTKYALFLPTRDDTTAADFAELFFEHVECRFGSPRSIVTDRDSRITSDFWREVCEIKMVKRRLSTAYHPQTDGQSEALNRIIEDYLRAYTSEDLTAWAKLLPLAQFAYNNSRNHTTGMSPNHLLHGFDCEIRIDVADTVSEKRIPAAKDRIEKLHQLRQKLRLRLIEAQERMANAYNARHVPKQFRVGEFVKLSTKNLRLKYRKLNPRWIGPFRVLERIGGQAYRLALPDKYAQLHPVFPIQLLETYRHRHDDSELMKMPDLEGPEDEWEVEEVRDKRRIKGVIHYLVKWSGWPSEYNSYEPAKHLVNAPKAIADFEHKLKRKRKEVKPASTLDDNEDSPAPRKRSRRS